MNDKLKNGLLSLAEKDKQLRQTIKDAGELPDEGYHPKLKALHEKNTLRAKEIITQFGWPRMSEVGDDGSGAI